MILVRHGLLSEPLELRRTLSHELTHLIHYSVQPLADSWIREGVAMLEETRLGRNIPPASLGAADLRPWVSLTERLALHMDADGTAGAQIVEHQPRYGTIFLYFSYVNRVCFAEGLVNRLFTAGATFQPFGRSEWDQFLRDHASPPCSGGFEASFRAYARARFDPDFSRPERHVFVSSSQPPLLSSASALAAHASTPDVALAYRAAADGSCDAASDERMASTLDAPEGRCLRVQLTPTRDSAPPSSRRRSSRVRR